MKQAFIFVLGLLLLCCTARPSAALYDEKYRPQYHFSPMNGWMGDPDGLVYYQGYYHMFWWGHAVSKDLVHWTELPWPFQGDPGGFQYFTGSAVVDKNNTAGLGANSMIAVYSMHQLSNNMETVGLSSSQDYTNFQYYPGNPVINENSTDFRDPTVFWHAGTNRWIMVIALPGIKMLHFYASTDLKNWQYLSDFGQVGAKDGIWECPDLFQLPVDGNTNNQKWVLSVAVGPNKVQYFTGNFDGTAFTMDAATDGFLKQGTGLDGTVFADFNGSSYNNAFGTWTTAGTAFGFGPDTWPTPWHLGAGQINSFGGGDAATGTLTSPTFTITYKAINFLIAGGNHPGQTCINLIVNNQVVRTATGDGTLTLKWNGWDVSNLIGQSAKLQLVDSYSGTDLGYLTLDHILFSDVLQNQRLEHAFWADHGPDFYAARTWRDIDNVNSRTTWIGWMGNWDYAADVPTSWGKGFQSVPREIGLKTFPEGVRLVQNPVPELNSLRKNHVSFSNRQINSGTVPLTEFVPSRNTYEIDATFNATTNTAFGFNLCVGSGRKLVVGYDARSGSIFLDRLNASDSTPNAAFPRKVYAPASPENNQIRLHIYVDQSSVEVFSNSGKVVLSAAIFPDNGQKGIELFSEYGTSTLQSFNAWELNSSWTNGGYKYNHIPGTLEAEDFNNGGQNVAYWDTDTPNNGNQYRTTEAVDLEVCSAGGYNVGWINAGEWLAYNYKADHNRTYQIETRVAGTGGQFHLEVDGVNVTGSIVVPNTGGFQQWSGIKTNVNLPFGEHTLKFVVESGGFNLDKFIVSSVIPGGIYKLTARHSQKAMDSAGSTDGAAVQQWDWQNFDNQKWKIESLEPGTYRITNLANGRALDMADSANGTGVLQWPWNGAAKQQWSITEAPDGHWVLTNKSSGKSLEVRSSSMVNGGVVQQWDYLGGFNQQWKLDQLSTFPSTLSINDVTLIEGNSGTTDAVFTVSLSAASSQIIKVNYATTNGTAVSGADFTHTSGTLTIAAGQMQGTIIVPITGETTHELNETFTLNLSSPIGASIADGTGSGTIVNNDTAPGLSVNDVTVAESGGNATFTVSLPQPSGFAVTVNYATQNGTAISGSDYTTTSGSLTFNVGQTTKTVMVPIFDDARDEANETFSLKLTSPTNAFLADDTGVGTITDNDTPWVTSGGIYRLVARHSGKVLDANGTANGAPIQQWTSMGYDNQKWKIEVVESGFYKLTAVSSNKVVDVADNANGTPALQWPWSTADKQRWSITDIGNGYKVLTSKTSGKSLEVRNSVTTDGGVAQQWDYVGGFNQQWTLEWGSALPPGSLSIKNAALVEGDSGSTNALFTVTLSEKHSQIISVQYATSNGTAISRDDYGTRSGTVAFAPDETTKTIIVPVNGDLLDENNETFAVTLTNPVNAVLVTATATATITDNDPLPNLNISDATLTEGNGDARSAVFRLTLSTPSGRDTGVKFTTAFGTAGPPDFHAKSDVVNFAAGESSKLVLVGVKGELIDEDDEQFSVSLSAPRFLTVMDGIGTGTIVDDDAAPLLTATANAVAEGNTSNQALVVQFKLAVPSSRNITVQYNTVEAVPRPATAGIDYLSIPPTVMTFVPGETLKNVPITIHGDTLDEDNELIGLALSNPANVTLAGSAVQGSIMDDDPLPVLTVAESTVMEGNSGTTTAGFQVRLSAPSGRVVKVSFAIADGTARAGSDYTAVTSTLIFQPGETIQNLPILIIGDTVRELDEHFTVKLSNFLNTAFVSKSATGRILNDDTATASFSTT